MHRAMMDAAERHGKFIARLAAERTRLQVAQVMGIGWLPATDEARLLHDVAKVLAAAIAPWRRNRKDALVDALLLTLVSAFAGDALLRPGNQRHRRPIVRGCIRIK